MQMPYSRFWRVGFLLLVAQAGSWTAAVAATGPLDVTSLFSAALRCETDFPDARNNGLAEQLRRQGVVVIDRAPGENLDLLYVFPEPLTVAGTRVSSVVVRGGSGSIVAARASGDPDDFARRVGLRPQPRRLWAMDGYGALPAQYARTMKPRFGIDESAPRVVMGRDLVTPKRTEFLWGCRSYDG